jgi:signal peptidase I
MNDEITRGTTLRPKLKMANGEIPARSRFYLLDARYWLRDLILSLLLAFIVIVFFYQPVQVEGTSMMPELYNHERIFINKFVYRFEVIHRFDIIVFHYPLDPSKSYIKRVVGLPGEWVSIHNGVVYIDAKPLKEPFIPPSYLDHDNYPSSFVPKANYFVLGDHRDDSNDSRVWGTVPRRYIYGKAVFVYWPLSELGALK